MSKKVPSALFDANQLEISDSEQESALATKEQLLEYALKKEEFESKQQDRKERKKYGIWAFFLVVGYLAVVLALVFFVGFGYAMLETPVLIGLVTTLATNVLGVFYFVMKYLFSK